MGKNTSERMLGENTTSSFESLLYYRFNKGTLRRGKFVEQVHVQVPKFELKAKDTHRKVTNWWLARNS